MPQAPIDMLHKCRNQFKLYAEQHRSKAVDESLPLKLRNIAINKALVDEQFVADIDATLRAWE